MVFIHCFKWTTLIKKHVSRTVNYAILVNLHNLLVIECKPRSFIRVLCNCSIVASIKLPVVSHHSNQVIQFSARTCLLDEHRHVQTVDLKKHVLINFALSVAEPVERHHKDRWCLVNLNAFDRLHLLIALSAQPGVLL
jgi:hypothetical protein